MSWFVYILRCADKSLYTGITTDLLRRTKEHNSVRGAKYTKPRQPVVLVYQEVFTDRGSALRREAAIKKLSKKEKEELLD